MYIMYINKYKRIHFLSKIKWTHRELGIKPLIFNCFATAPVSWISDLNDPRTIPCHTTVN